MQCSDYGVVITHQRTVGLVLSLTGQRGKPDTLRTVGSRPHVLLYKPPGVRKAYAVPIHLLREFETEFRDVIDDVATAKEAVDSVFDWGGLKVGSGMEYGLFRGGIHGGRW